MIHLICLLFILPACRGVNQVDYEKFAVKTDVDSQIQNLETQISVFDTEHTRSTKQISAELAKAQESNKDAQDQLKQNLNTLSGRTDNIERKAENTINNFNTQINDLSATVNKKTQQLTTDVVANTQELTSQTKKIKTLETTVQTQGTSISTLDTKVANIESSLMNEVQNLQNTHAEGGEKVTGVMAKVNDIEQTVKSSTLAMNGLQGSIDKVSESLTSLQQEFQVKLDKESKKTKDLAKQNRDELSNKLEEGLSNINLLDKELKKIKKQVQTMKKDASTQAATMQAIREETDSNKKLSQEVFSQLAEQVRAQAEKIEALENQMQGSQLFDFDGLKDKFVVYKDHIVSSYSYVLNDAMEYAGLDSEQASATMSKSWETISTESTVYFNMASEYYSKASNYTSEVISEVAPVVNEMMENAGATMTKYSGEFGETMAEFSANAGEKLSQLATEGGDKANELVKYTSEEGAKLLEDVQKLTVDDIVKALQNGKTQLLALIPQGEEVYKQVVDLLVEQQMTTPENCALIVDSVIGVMVFIVAMIMLNVSYKLIRMVLSVMCYVLCCSCCSRKNKNEILESDETTETNSSPEKRTPEKSKKVKSSKKDKTGSGKKSKKSSKKSDKKKDKKSKK